MKEVVILVTRQALIAAVGNTRYMFEKVNSFLENSGADPLFDVQLVAAEEEISLDEGVYSVRPDLLLKDRSTPDLIIIPPTSGSMESCIENNQDYIDWMVRKHDQGAEIASLCVGAYLLAESGLLSGMECSTHWQTSNQFKNRFPDIKLVDWKILTDHNGLYTSGGANSYWNLLVYLVQKYTSREIAILTAKYFEVEMSRNSQSNFLIFEGFKQHGDETIKEVQEFIEQNFEEKLTIEDLCDGYPYSRRTFQRRFKLATHYTVVEYIQKVRMEAAKKLLEQGDQTIQEIMYGVGYTDPKAFRDVFRKNVGCTPLSYKKKYSSVH